MPEPITPEEARAAVAASENDPAPVTAEPDKDTPPAVEPDPAPEPAKEPDPVPDETPEGNPDPKDEPAEEEDSADDEGWPELPEDDEVGNALVSELRSSGVTPAEASAIFGEALDNLDASKVDVATLEAKVGKAKATMLLSGVKTKIAEEAAVLSEVKGYTVEAAGSAENWSKVAAWAKAEGNVDPNTLSQYREMISRGGAMARFATGEIVGMYNKDNRNTSVGGKIIPADAPAKTPAVEPISRLEYGQALQKAIRKGAKPAELEKLKAQRQAGVKKGL